MLRTRRHLAPSWAMERAVDHRRMNRAPERFLVSRWDGSCHPHPTGLGLFQKRRESGLLWFRREVSRPTPATRFAPAHDLASMGVVRVQLAHRW